MHLQDNLLLSISDATKGTSSVACASLPNRHIQFAFSPDEDTLQISWRDGTAVATLTISRYAAGLIHNFFPPHAQRTEHRS